jgi:hypothetical protein
VSSAPIVYIDAVGREVFVDKRRVLKDGGRVMRYGVFTRLAPYVVTKVGGIPLTEQRREASRLLKEHANRLGWKVKEA